MLDSGAYSAWTRGEQLDVGEYAEFVKQYEVSLDTYINLDVIPGSKGVRPTVREVEYAAAKSFENYEVMRDADLQPIPVFHYGESFRWLEKLVEAGAPYICIGGTVGVPIRIKQKFFDECFTALTNASGKPVVKVHGLGVTDGKSVLRYPWHSVDSTSWVVAPCHGIVIVPGEDKRRFGKQIHIGNAQVTGSFKTGSFDYLSDSAQGYVRKFAQDNGVEITDLRNDVYSRMLLFVKSLLVLQGRATTTFKHRRGSFHQRQPMTAKPARTDFRIIFAGDTTTHHDSILTMCGAGNRLWSYYSYRDDGDRLLRRIAEQAEAAPYDPRNRSIRRTDWKSLNYHDHRRRQLVGRFKEDESEQEAAV